MGGRLVTIARDGAEGVSYPLTGEQIDIGREEGAILLRDDAYVSPRHLRLVRREDGWYARDFGSVNGIFYGSANRTPSSTETCSWWAFRC